MVCQIEISTHGMAFLTLTQYTQFSLVSLAILTRAQKFHEKIYQNVYCYTFIRE